MRIIITIISAAFLLTMVLASCARVTEYPSVKIRPHNEFNYEIELQYNVEGRRRPSSHNNYNFSKFDEDKSHWIYTNEISGKVNASEIILRFQRGISQSPSDFRNIKGFIEFTNDSLSIFLSPVHPQEIVEKIPEGYYIHNGKYRIEQAE